MAHLGYHLNTPGALLEIACQFVNTTGTAATASSTTARIYRGTTAMSINPITLTAVDGANAVGEYRASVDISTSEFEVGQYTIRYTGTIDGETPAAVDRFTIGVEDSLRSLKAQAGAASTITLDASASGTNDIYNGLQVVLVSGTGAGQVRLITDYDGTSKVATVSRSWTTNPASGTGFSLIAAEANLVAIDAEDLPNATLALKQLLVVNSSGVGISVTASTDAMQLLGGSVTQLATGRALLMRGAGTAEGMRVIGGATSGNAALFDGSNGTAGQCVLGAGDGNGMYTQGTGTGHGALFVSGTGSGASGVKGQSTAAAGKGHGFEGIGTRGGAGVYGDGGAGINDSGAGMELVGGNAAAGGAVASGLYSHARVTDAHGARFVGFGAGHGLVNEGGATSGHGQRNLGGAPNGRGVSNEGTGTGAGVRSVGGATGHGQHSVGGGTSGHGEYSQGQGNGDGVRGEGGATAGNAGVFGVSGVGGAGFRGLGDGAGAGGLFTGGATGPGFDMVGGTGADGARATGGSGGHGYHGRGGTVNGAGARFAAQAGNAPGMELQGVGVSPGLRSVGGATDGDGAQFQAQGSGNAIEALVVTGEPLSQNIEDQLVDGTVTDILNASIATFNPGTVGEALAYARAFAKNRYLIDETAFTFTLYQDDGITPLKVFDLKDQNGLPSVDEPFERVPI